MNKTTEQAIHRMRTVGASVSRAFARWEAECAQAEQEASRAIDAMLRAIECDAIAKALVS